MDDPLGTRERQALLPASGLDAIAATRAMLRTQASRITRARGGGGLGGDFFYFSLSLAGFGELLYLLKQCGLGVLDLVTGVRSALPGGLGACLRALLW